MGDIVSLKLHRKRKERAAKDDKAAENRAKFGRTREEKDHAEAQRKIDDRHLDGHRRDED